jgi:hypothetical protein
MPLTIIGAAYDPPRLGLPHVAVALCDGQVLQAQAVDSVQAGEAFLAAITEKYSADIGEVRPQLSPDLGAS